MGRSGELEANDADERLPELIAKLLQIPVEVRTFSVPAEQARIRYGIGGELLETMTRHGLPCVTDGQRGGRRFDPDDLHNLSIELRLRSPWAAAMRRWPRALEQEPASGEVVYRMDYVPACAAPKAHDRCRFTVLMPGGKRAVRTHDGQAPRVVATAEFRLRTRWPAFPPAVCELIDQVRDIRLMRLPFALRGDTAFIRRSGMSDCRTMAEFLVQQGTRRGLPARCSYGLIVASPFATRHHWSEFQIEGLWVPVDPLLVAAMVRWGLLDGRRRTPYGSPGALLGRLAGRRQPLALDGEVETEVSLPVRRVA